MNKKDNFITKSKNVHGDKYDYSLVDYVNNKTKVKIICPIHGVFEQTPNQHTSKKQGCKKCNFDKIKMNIETFIKRSEKIHNYKYDYSLVEYINSHTKVKIVCPEHGVFEQKPYSHLVGKGCMCCSVDKKTLDIKEFIEKTNKVHNNKYDYSQVKYKNNIVKIKIKCPKHGYFLQNPNRHLQGHGCPICNESKGEREISKILDKNNIKYIRQEKFEDCKDKRSLPFDFYIQDYDLCIEYDGIQHFKVIEYWGGEEKLKLTQKHDKIKNKYCKENNINLIRIRYDENINDKLNEIIKI